MAASPQGSRAPAGAGAVLVTGANRGLGREVCRQLAAAGWDVWLTAREGAQARAVAAELGAERADGGRVRAMGLDVGDAESVAALAAALRDEAGKDARPLAALVNNAGVSRDGFNDRVVRETLAVNFYGAERVAAALRPLLAPRGRVVMVSSGMGELSGFPAALRAPLERDDLTRAVLEAWLEDFTQAVAEGSLRRRGWPRSAYSVSKAALNALTRLLARAEGPRGLRCNAVCPGWVRTRMGGRGASRSVATGARGIAWAATLPPDGPTGGFFRDGKPIDW